MLACNRNGNGGRSRTYDSDATANTEPNVKTARTLAASACAILSFVWNVESLAQLQSESGTGFTSFLDTEIDDFSVTDASMRRVVRRLHAREMPISFAERPIGRGDVRPTLSISLKQASLRQVLDALIRVDPGYTYESLASGMILISPASASVFDWPVPRLSCRELPIAEFLQRHEDALGFSERRVSYYFGPLRGLHDFFERPYEGLPNRKISLDLPGGSVRDCVAAICAQVSGACYTVFSNNAGGRARIDLFFLLYRKPDWAPHPEFPGIAASFVGAGLVPSIHSLYTADDGNGSLFPYGDDLVGEWRPDLPESKQSDRNDGDDALPPASPIGSSATLTFTADGESAVALCVDENGTNHEFTVRSILVNACVFFDFFPVCTYEQTEGFDSPGLLPVHTFMRVGITQGRLNLDYLNLQGLAQILDENPGLLDHEYENGRCVLTAEPKELQEFLLQHTWTRDLWQPMVPLVRIDGNGANQTGGREE